MNLLRPGLYGKLAYNKWREAWNEWREANIKRQEARDKWQEAVKLVPGYLRSILDEPA